MREEEEFVKAAVKNIEETASVISKHIQMIKGDEAEKFADKEFPDGRECVTDDRWAICAYSFRSGHSAGFAEAVAMLRSEEARKFQKEQLPSMVEWADWLESLGKNIKEK